jgi:hypothetical protein
VPFDLDPDGDGQVTVTVEAWSGTVFGPKLTEESFTFPVGTTHDLSGSWSVAPTMNPVFINVSQATGSNWVGVTFNGACDTVTIWQQPYVLVGTALDQLPVYTYNSCYGTTLALRVRGPDGALLSEATTTATSRLPYGGPLLVPVPGGLPPGVNTLEAVCGSFAEPLSAVWVASFTVTAPEPPTDGQLPYLVDVRVAGHETYDRVVFEFAGPLPEQLESGFVLPPLGYPPTGVEVTVAGSAFYQLVFSGAETYTGPGRVTGDTEIVTEVVEIVTVVDSNGDFESTLYWVIGMTTKVTPTVTTLTNPSRVVIDVPYPSPTTSTTTAKATTTAQPTYTG